MNNNKIVVIGASGFAKNVIDAIEKEGRFEIAGIIDKNHQYDSIFLGYKILGDINALPEIKKKLGVTKGVIAIGTNWLRMQVYQIIKEILPDFEFITTVHPNACIGKNVQIENGSIIFACAVIETNAKIGICCVLQNNSSLNHDCEMANFSLLGPGAIVGGYSKVGLCTAILLGSKVIHKIEIGEHSIIGAGSLVIRNIPAFAVAYGAPAKIVRNRSLQERYY